MDSSERRGTGEGERALRIASRAVDDEVADDAEVEGTARLLARESVARDDDERKAGAGGAPDSGMVIIFGRSRDLRPPNAGADCGRFPLGSPPRRRRRLGLSSESFSMRNPVSKSSSSSACFDFCFGSREEVMLVGAGAAGASTLR